MLNAPLYAHAQEELLDLVGTARLSGKQSKTVAMAITEKYSANIAVSCTKRSSATTQV